MKQWRDKLQLRTRREPPVPPIEDMSTTNEGDKWIFRIGVLGLILILVLAAVEYVIGRAL
jgi:hypothetical protein